MTIAATTAAPAKVGKVRAWFANNGPVLGIFIAIFLLWELCCRLFRVPDFILPSPSVIIDKIISSWWLLLMNGLVTAQEIVLGFGMSVAVGIPLAVLVVYSRIFERVAFPFMVSLQTIPKVALAPILVMWLGYGILPKVMVAFLISFFPIVIAAVVGMRSAEKEMIYLVQSMGANELTTFLKIRLPRALPSIFGGLKVGMGQAVVGATVGEFIAAEHGLGYLQLISQVRLDTALLVRGRGGAVAPRRAPVQHRRLDRAAGAAVEPVAHRDDRVAPMATGSGAPIALRGVSKRYMTASGDAVDALAEIDLDIAAGEFVSIVGPSGCGKSTLMMLVSGLIPATTGAITVGGTQVKGAVSKAGVVFQRDVLLDWRTVLGNVLLPVEIKKLDRETHLKKARDLLRSVGLAEFEEKYPAELSGGMRQRVAICRALVQDPGLLLMDEPFGALDALTREQMNLDLQRIWLRDRNTVIFITHSIEEAVLLSDRVVVMTSRPGRIADILSLDLPRPRGAQTRSEKVFVDSVERIRRHFMALGVLSET